MKIYIEEFNEKIISKDSMNLAKKAISETFKIESENIVIKRMETGKPYVESEKDIFFNISHSHKVLVCGVSKFNIGVDVEKMLNKDFKTLSKVFCTDKEYDYICKLPDSNRKKEFYKLWTAKESFSKLLGKGLKIQFSKFEIIDNIITFNEKKFKLKHYIFKEEYIICICEETQFA